MYDYELAEEFRGLFSYDEVTGKCIEKTKRNKCVEIGDEVGYLSEGYRKFHYKGRIYMVHRVIWLMVHNKWPDRLIDHKNGIRDDNSLKNLREATPQENCRNRHNLHRRNTSGYAGISKRRHPSGKENWYVRIKVDYTYIFLGLYPLDQLDKAVARRQAAEIEYFGEFAPSHDRMLEPSRTSV